MFLECKHIIEWCVDIFVLDFMLARKTLTDFTNLFEPNNFKKNDEIILKYFMTNI